MSSVVVLTTTDEHREQTMQALSGDMELRPASTLKELSDAMLWDDTEAVIIDVATDKVDPLEAVRLVKGTRWDVALICIGEGELAERAARGGVDVHGSDTWQDLRQHIHG